MSKSQDHIDQTRRDASHGDAAVKPAKPADEPKVEIVQAPKPEPKPELKAPEAAKPDAPKAS
jgi:hypothetical protein